MPDVAISCGRLRNFTLYREIATAYRPRDDRKGEAISENLTILVIARNPNGVTWQSPSKHHRTSADVPCTLLRWMDPHSIMFEKMLLTNAAGCVKVWL